MFLEYQPKSYPSELLQKDWTKRKMSLRYGSQEFLNRVHDLEVREDDVWIVTMAKCGTTWMQEMVWLLLNDCDFEAAKSKHLELRSPFLEFPVLINEDGKSYLEELSNLKSPRVIKTHLPLPFLPKQIRIKKPKLIYVFRDPRDAFTSAFYFRQNFGFGLNKTLAEEIDSELNEQIRTNQHWNHVLEFYALRNETWIHYTSFERMKRDLHSELAAVSKFLNVTISNKKVEQLIHHLSFDEMKKNPTCNHKYEIEIARQKMGPAISYKDNHFMRKGKVGSYKEELPTELIQQLDEWIEQNLKPLNLNLNDLLLL